MVGLFSNEVSFYKSSFRRYGVVSPLSNVSTAFARAGSTTSKATSAVLVKQYETRREALSQIASRLMPSRGERI